MHGSFEGCGWLMDFFGKTIILTIVSFVLLSGISFSALVPSGVGVVLFFNGEFDPGSGRTLAACLTHASRAVRPFGVHERRTGE
jgi:hypothetical protein